MAAECVKATLLSAFSILFFLVACLDSAAQKNLISGKVTDTAEKRNLPFAIAALIDQKDTTFYRSVRTDVKGDFYFTGVTPGKYTLVIIYPKMADYLLDIEVKDTSKLKLGDFPMTMMAKLLEEVIVRSAPAIRMKGDTLEYKADSFYVNQGANVQDLLKRLPGIIVEKSGRIIAQGQEVKKLLVDGDEFFADDPKLAAKYLAAGAVDKVQVYEGKSENAVFTGIDDGQRTKTMNLKLKAGHRNGHFGKLGAGSDGSKYYNTEAMGALFNKDMKVSLFGTSSKTGQAGVSNNELGKYVAKDYEIISDGTGGLIMHSNDSYESSSYYGSGIPTVTTAGAHFSNRWKNKTQKLFTNYRLKNIDSYDRVTGSNLTVLPDGSSFTNLGNSELDRHSLTQKASGSFELPLDSLNTTLKISVNGSIGRDENNNKGISSSSNQNNIIVNSSQSYNLEESNTGRYETNLLLRHKFKKSGRTLTASVQQQYGQRNEDEINYSQNQFFDENTGVLSGSQAMDQLQVTNRNTQSLAGKASYGDKLSENWVFAVDYGFKRVDVEDIFSTWNKKGDKYLDRVDSLSIDYNFIVNTHITGASLAWNKKKVRVTMGSQFFLTGFEQTNRDLKETTTRNFMNIAPSFRAEYVFKPNTSLSINYSGHTEQPQVEQLQPLRRSSNPLYIQLGNPDLKPAFANSFGFTYTAYNFPKQKQLYISATASFDDNAISSTELIDAKGRTLTQYINIDGNRNYYANMNYGWMNKKLHLRNDLSASVNGSRNYSIVNGVRAMNDNNTVRISGRTAYDLRDKVTISYGPSIDFSVGSSSLRNIRNTTWSHNHSVSASVWLPAKIELSSDCGFRFQPKNKVFNESVTVITWNAELTRKFLKGDKGEVKLSVEDLLNQNTGYSRNVYGNSVNESNRLVIKRYFLLAFAWNFASKL